MREVKQGSYLRGEEDGKSWPQFFMHPTPDPIASEREGRPMFRDVEMVKITFAGNPYNIPVVEVTDEHRTQWPKAYDAFKNKGTFAVDGTPLEEWPGAGSVSRIAELKALGIMTVENLAAVDDHGIQRLGMGSRELVAKAKAYLESARGNSPVEALAAESVRQAEEILFLRQQLADLKAAMDASEATKNPEPKGRKAA